MLLLLLLLSFLFILLHISDISRMFDVIHWRSVCLVHASNQLWVFVVCWREVGISKSALYCGRGTTYLWAISTHSIFVVLGHFYLELLEHFLDLILAAAAREKQWSVPNAPVWGMQALGETRLLALTIFAAWHIIKVIQGQILLALDRKQRQQKCD